MTDKKLDFYYSALNSVASKCGVSASIAHDVLFNATSTTTKKQIDTSIDQLEIEAALTDAGLLLVLQGAAV